LISIEGPPIPRPNFSSNVNSYPNSYPHSNPNSNLNPTLTPTITPTLTLTDSLDDAFIAHDFFDFMAYGLKLLEADPTIFTVSPFNYNGGADFAQALPPHLPHFPHPHFSRP